MSVANTDSSDQTRPRATENPNPVSRMTGPSRVACGPQWSLALRSARWQEARVGVHLVERRRWRVCLDDRGRRRSGWGLSARRPRSAYHPLPVPREVAPLASAPSRAALQHHCRRSHPGQIRQRRFSFGCDQSELHRRTWIRVDFDNDHKAKQGVGFVHEMPPLR